jgi:hypothetical protein
MPKSYKMALKITCISKSNGQHENQHVAITNLSWINELNNENGNSSRIQMYEWVLKGGIAYVYDKNGNRAKLVTAISIKGNKYVKTENDSLVSDNLLKLPEC